ncbi:hypothetical protein [Thermogymnomonas acidicola]|uniref:hypothetical protein n=1 Tax=Thermogymnomonas acidicola TaxID=399579 RepID=UPI000946604B|nr:hypothetical protein [Thermogymnomonas acidicola]
MTINEEYYVMAYGMGGNASYNVTVFNLGDAPIVPAFSVSPSVPMYVYGGGSPIEPGGRS